MACRRDRRRMRADRCDGPAPFEAHGTPGAGTLRPSMRATPTLVLAVSMWLAVGCGGGESSDVTGGVCPSRDRPDAGAVAASAGGDPAILAIDGQIAAASVDRTMAGWRTHLPLPTAVTFTPGRSYLWTLATDKGELRVKLRPEAAPMHVTSTIYLTRLGFYDSLTFHRIIRGFMAQGGDPVGDGSGGPGYHYGVEATACARHDGRGVVSMANAGPNTEGSQFFITFAAQPALDGSYSVFGNVVAGTDTLSAIEAGGTAAEGRPTIVTITSASISVE
jgi:peptidyl-prolyl cis-trans isomerase B (cyclophilin B)